MFGFCAYWFCVRAFGGVWLWLFVGGVFCYSCWFGLMVEWFGSFSFTVLMFGCYCCLVCLLWFYCYGCGCSSLGIWVVTCVGLMVVICCSDWFGLVWFWVDGLVCWLLNCLVLLLGLLPLLDAVVGLF